MPAVTGSKVATRGAVLGMSTSEQVTVPRGRAGRRSRSVVALALVGLLGVAGCSKGDPAPPPGLNTNSTLPGNTGASCVDPTGDISDDPSTLGGNRTDPAGIDLVSAKATLTESTLKVEFNTAGPIEGTKQPEFILDQGEFGQEGAWELKARIDQTGAWQLVMATWRKNASGAVAEVPGQVIKTSVTVAGTKLSYEVSQKDIPPAASYVWLFGATSGVDSPLIDNCDNAGGGSSGSTPPTTPTATTPPTTATNGSLRQAQTAKRGETVTVFSVESPPAAPQAGATPADPAPDALPGEAPRPPFKLAVVDAKVCAPAGQATTVGSFYVKADDGTNWPVHPVAVSAHDPVLVTGQALEANVCKQGWVTLQLPETSTVTQVLYIVDPQNPTDALIWNAA